MTYTYEYKKPEGTHSKISIKDWNKLSGSSFRKYVTKIDVYVTTETVRVEISKSLFGKFIFSLISPIVMVWGILECGLSETIEDFKDVYFDKSRGKFRSYTFFRKHEPVKFNQLSQNNRYY